MLRLRVRNLQELREKHQAGDYVSGKCQGKCSSCSMLDAFSVTTFMPDMSLTYPQELYIRHQRAPSQSACTPQETS